MSSTTAGDVGSGRCCKYVLGADGEYVPGQHEVKILDPHPQRDRSDLAAVLTFVDEDRFACHVLCVRDRATGWRSIKVRRSTPRKLGRSTLVNVPRLEGDLLTLVEATADGHPGFPYEPPSDDERAIRRLAQLLWNKTA